MTGRMSELASQSALTPESRHEGARAAAPKKRALFVLLKDGPGGAQRVTTLIARALAERPDWSVTVHVLCSRLEPSFTGSELPDDVEVVYGRSGSVAAGVPALIRTACRARWDLIFSSFVFTNAVLSGLRRAFPRLTKRLITRESTVPADQFTGLKRLAYRQLYRLYGRQELVIAQTGYMSRMVARNLPKAMQPRIVVLPNPIDLNRVETLSRVPLDPSVRGALPEVTRIAFCGVLIPRKRPLLAIEAVEHASIVLGRPLQLVILGDGPLLSEVKVRAAAADVPVLCLGHQTNPYNVIAACDYGLITSMTEGFPNVLLEMMACGTRSVVTTNCCGDLDTVPGVVIAKDDSSQTLGTALAREIESSGSRASFSQEVQRRSPVSFLQAILADMS